ncbi:hypothetical protein [Paraburkholderia adhaesiva]|uniref:hypothetical protein n=1 Tax=Paraburkholderia adhaesiva TaxID=2883244 RepID=UPI001F170068|nr:hypothetical protein [Paraburkholderia adhaesiva]
MMIAVYAALHVALALAAAWMIVLRGQPLFWRIVFGLVLAGTLWNLTGLIWLHYTAIWPGEPTITLAFCLLLGGLLSSRQGPVTPRALVRKL